jgi:hypothetical protein
MDSGMLMLKDRRRTDFWRSMKVLEMKSRGILNSGVVMMVNESRCCWRLLLMADISFVDQIFDSVACTW